jgi:hypothetical protein
VRGESVTYKTDDDSSQAEATSPITFVKVVCRRRHSTANEAADLPEIDCKCLVSNVVHQMQSRLLLATLSCPTSEISSCRAVALTGCT